MNTSEIHQSALDLPEDQRALLLTDLINSLPAVLADFDDGTREAQRRLEEMKSDPSARRSWDEIKDGLGR